MKILICGDRHWKDRKTIFDTLRPYAQDNPTIIHGGATGADTIAGKAARAYGLKIIQHRAKWDEHGRAAGPIRNKKMLAEHPDLVLAFHNDIDGSKGTLHMVSIARDAGIKVIVVTA